MEDGSALYEGDCINYGNATEPPKENMENRTNPREPFRAMLPTASLDLFISSAVVVF